MSKRDKPWPCMCCGKRGKQNQNVALLYPRFKVTLCWACADRGHATLAEIVAESARRMRAASLNVSEPQKKQKEAR